MLLQLKNHVASILIMLEICKYKMASPGFFRAQALQLQFKTAQELDEISLSDYIQVALQSGASL